MTSFSNFFVKITQKGGLQLMSSNRPIMIEEEFESGSGSHEPTEFDAGFECIKWPAYECDFD